MMKDNWFENKMNERFEDFDSELDLHAAWADLEARREPRKKKRRSGMFWWFGAGTAVFLIGIGLLFNSIKETNLSESNKTARLEHIAANNKSPNSTQSTENQINTQKTGQPKSSENEIKNRENIHREKSLEKENNNSKRYLNLNNSIPKYQNTKSSYKLPILQLDKEEMKTLNPEISTQIEEPYSSIALIEALQKDIPSLQTEFLPHNIECSFRGNHPKLRTFGISINYGKAFRNTPIGRGLNSAYLNKRDEAEKPLDAWSAQFFYQLRNKKHWFGRVNFGYSQTTDLFQDSYSTSNLVLQDDQVLQINRYPDGSTEEIKASILVNSEESSSGKFYQRYRQVFIGLELGKEKSLPSGFNLRAALGGDFTIYQNNTGKVYLNDNSTFGSYQDLSAISTKKGGMFAAKLKLEIGKTFSFHNEISLGIVGKTNLRIMKNDLGRRQYLLGELSYRKNF